MSSWGSIYETTRAAIRVNGQALARLQEMAASGSRINRASDAPADAFRVLNLRADSLSAETYRKNIGRVTDSLNASSSILSQMTEVLSRARQLVIQGTSGTYAVANRRPIGQEINSILEELVSLANTRYGGRYLFAGSSADTLPYVTTVENGQIVRVDYDGSRGALEVPVAPGVDYPGTLVGDAIFRSTARQTPQYLGETGAAAGTGTSNVRGDVWLTVTHDATAYLGASGVAAGDSTASDTVLGNGHTLTIDALNHTLQLDDGTAVTFADGATNVRLTNAAGDVVYVSVAALDPAFQGTVGLSATGKVSTDDGATETAIDFADANLAVTDSRTGRVLYVDCTGIERTGLEPVRVPGTYDMFGALVTLRDLLLNTRNLSENDQLAALSDMAASLQEVMDGLTAASTSVGAGIGAMTSLDGSLESLQNSAQDQAAVLENADIVEVATELARRQTLYEMTLQSAAILLRLSLFDYID